MKRAILFFVISNLFISISTAQTLTEQIEYAYSNIDTASYIDNMILSYAKSFDKMDKNTDKFLGIIRTDSATLGDIQKYNSVDSICSKYIQRGHTMTAQWIKEFVNEVKSKMAIFVLNLKVKDERTLQVDTGRLAFNLFYFDKRYKGRLYVYCNDGEYSWKDSGYRTFSRKHARKAPKAFRRIMRKHPKYLLFCPDLEGMNTILYVINNEVYVYRIVEMQEYKLDDYMKNRDLYEYYFMYVVKQKCTSANIVTLFDNIQYYSPDHYETFIQFKP